jgi:hypothetical protein
VVFNQRIMKDDDARKTEEILEGLTGYSPQSAGTSGFSWRTKKNLTQGGRGGQQSGWLASSRSRDVFF